MKYSQDNGDKNNYLSRLQKFAEANKHLANTPKVKIPDTPPAPAAIPTATAPVRKAPAPFINFNWKDVGMVLVATTIFLGGYEIAKGAIKGHIAQNVAGSTRPSEEAVTREAPNVVAATNSIYDFTSEAPVTPVVGSEETVMPMTITPNTAWSWCFTNNFAGGNGTNSISLGCGVQAYNTSEGLYVTAEFETGVVASYLIGVNGQSTTYINEESFESRYYIVTHEDLKYYEFQSNGLIHWIPIHSIEASIL